MCIRDSPHIALAIPAPTINANSIRVSATVEFTFMDRLGVAVFKGWFDLLQF
jgi:hypothetical protein